MISYTDTEAAKALVKVLKDSRWEAVILAHGYLAKQEEVDNEQAARIVYEQGGKRTITLRRSRKLIEKSSTEGFVALLTERRRTGPAENPITKLFPGAITEQRSLELMDKLSDCRSSISYVDDRESGHTLSDFTLLEDDLELPLNIKTAGARFEKAKELVGLDPDDCIPIPVYKAHGALDRIPNLIYVVSVDYSLIDKLDVLLSEAFDRDELIVWDLLNRYAGPLRTRAEDAFVYEMVGKHWDKLKEIASDKPFHVISARKAVRILQTEPRRTPGIGMKAWGTGASSEINVHVSIQHDTTPWDTVSSRICSNGIEDIIEAVNRKHREWVYDPEI